jgi:tRNA (Thr-GGU) A37 N-methylase
VFATRAPRRPNPLGLSIVRLISIQQNVIEFDGADMLDGTPLLDIKPYIQQFDKIAHSSSGWLTASDREIRAKKSDDRFVSS